MKGGEGWTQFNDLSVKFTGQKADKCQRGGCESDTGKAETIKVARGGRHNSCCGTMIKWLHQRDFQFGKEEGEQTDAG